MRGTLSGSVHDAPLKATANSIVGMSGSLIRTSLPVNMAGSCIGPTACRQDHARQGSSQATTACCYTTAVTPQTLQEQQCNKDKQARLGPCSAEVYRHIAQGPTPQPDFERQGAHSSLQTLLRPPEVLLPYKAPCSITPASETHLPHQVHASCRVRGEAGKSLVRQLHQLIVLHSTRASHHLKAQRGTSPWQKAAEMTGYLKENKASERQAHLLPAMRFCLKMVAAKAQPPRYNLPCFQASRLPQPRFDLVSPTEWTLPMLQSQRAQNGSSHTWWLHAHSD